MLVSRKCDYAIRALVYLAGKPVTACSSIREISEHEDIPREFAAKILKGLKVAGFLRSVKGVHGGYVLSKDPDEISLYEIITAMEGPLGFNLCVTGNSGKNCSRSETCPMHTFWESLQNDVANVLKNKTITPFVVQGKEP